MNENYAWFSSFTKIENSGDVSFRDNSKGKILGIGNVSKVTSTLIENVCLVESLKHNLISISQLCDKGYKVALINQDVLLRMHVMEKFCLWEIDVAIFTQLI